jgi:hypothetical protein
MLFCSGLFCAMAVHLLAGAERGLAGLLVEHFAGCTKTF